MEKSRARVICNPTSGGGAYDPDEIRAGLEGLEVEWIETEGPEDAIGAAEEWRGGLLIVAGGDGTINDVVNGLGRADFPEDVTLGILPTGTGNDLAATLEIPKDADLAEDVIRQNRVRTLDVARVRSEGVGEKYFINVATGGLGAEISDANEGEFKKRWGKLSYLRASLEVAKDFDVRELDLSLDGELRKVRAVNVVVGQLPLRGRRLARRTEGQPRGRPARCRHHRDPGGRGPAPARPGIPDEEQLPGQRGCVLRAGEGDPGQDPASWS